jgi:hypothetical protein
MVNNEVSGLVVQIENMIYKEALMNWISSMTRDPKVKDAFVESLIDLGYYDQFIENNEEEDEDEVDEVDEEDDSINDEIDNEENYEDEPEINAVKQTRKRKPIKPK